MSGFEELGEYIDESPGFINVVGVPRSISTAFCRALNESSTPSIFVNEPFNRENADLDTAAESILAVLEQVQEPHLVIVKNMASYLSAGDFTALNEIATHTIFTIRNPLVQIGSLLTRLVNDSEIFPGSSQLQQDDIYPYLDRVVEILVDSPRSKDFSKTGWKAMLEHFSLKGEAPTTVIDGDVFTRNPELILRMVCQRVVLEYSPAMISGWGSDFLNVINIGKPDETLQSAWTCDVASSSGVSSNARGELDVSRLPSELARHISGLALPAYLQLVEESHPGQETARGHRAPQYH
ncbi:MAG: hypothetical protein U0520_02685 [Candidatus Saccharimonadales bacterium]